MTYEMLAEEQEMLARARHARAQTAPSLLLQNAMRSDSPDACGQARQFREMHTNDMVLIDGLAMMLSIDPIGEMDGG